jgi:hypothetical protein
MNDLPAAKPHILQIRPRRLVTSVLAQSSIPAAFRMSFYWHFWIIIPNPSFKKPHFNPYLLPIQHFLGK